MSMHSGKVGERLLGYPPPPIKPIKSALETTDLYKTAGKNRLALFFCGERSIWDCTICFVVGATFKMY